MASLARRLATNTAGDLFVDDSCIDCGACRWIAPHNFDRVGSYSRVHHQPATAAERHRALQALVACPTASIGAAAPAAAVRQAARSFPDPIEGGVHHCGYHAEKSFGAASYLIVRRDEQGRPANVLVDCPRYNAGLVKRIHAHGGATTMVLTHRDDVADHARYAERFGCTRVLWRDDVSASTRAIERQPQGSEPYALAPDLLLIPTPGHTRGSACLLYRGQFLFTGDHLAFHLARQQLYAFRRACWYDWHVQIASMRRLLAYRFRHVLPGHGAPCHLPEPDMHAQLRRCITWMEQQP